MIDIRDLVFTIRKKIKAPMSLSVFVRLENVAHRLCSNSPWALTATPVRVIIARKGSAGMESVAMTNGAFERTVKNLLKMPHKPHKPAKADDGNRGKAQPKDENPSPQTTRPRERKGQ